MAYGLVPEQFNGQYEIVHKVVVNSNTITKYDPVFLEDDQADLAAATEQLFGVALDTVTGDGTLTIPVLVGTDVVYRVDNDNDTNTFAASGYGGGKMFDITGATGAVQVDTSTAGTTGQLVCVHESPDSSDASIGLFKINKAESQR